MAAGKVSLSRRVDLSHVSKRVSNSYVVTSVDYDVKDCGVRGDEFMDVEEVTAPPPKRRKFSPVVWDKEGSVKRRTVGIDDDYEPGKIEEEDYGCASNITTSRWAVDDDVVESDENMGGAGKRVEEIRRKSSSPESGITQKDGSDCSGFRSSGSDEGYLRRYYGGDECSESDSENDDCMDIDVGDGEGLMGSQSDSDSDYCSFPLAREPVRRNMLQGCRSVYEFERLSKISEGSYGIVHKGRDKSSGELVALKKMKMTDESEGFSVCYLREINTLLALNHPSIVNVREVVVDESADDAFNNVFMVMDYVEHDLKALMQLRKQTFSQSEVKCLMLQLLGGVKYLHDNWVLHRDLKTSNLLVNNKGELKICDFGMARQYGSPLKPYTSLVVTLWYRAPELLLGAKEYSTAVDMWSVGCIMAELLKNQPLFDGKTEPEQLNKIFKLLGTPNKKIWPGFFQLPGAKAKFADHQYNRLHTLFPRAVFTGSPILSDSGLDLLSRLLTCDPEKRITAEEALSHRWFQEVPLPNTKEFMPTFPAEKIFDELQVQGHGTSGSGNLSYYEEMITRGLMHYCF